MLGFPIKNGGNKTIPDHFRDREFLEVTGRFELPNDGFADRCLTTWLRHHMNFWNDKGGSNRFRPWVRAEIGTLERVTRLELATSTLARWRSTG